MTLPTQVSIMPEQQTLFDPEPAPWELDDAAQQHVATVVLASGPGGEFDYLVPDELTLDGGLPGEGAAGARESQRGGLLRGGRLQAGGRAEAQGDRRWCSTLRRCCRRRCCG